MLSLIQFRTRSAERGVAAIHDGGKPVAVPGAVTILGLADQACRNGSSLSELVAASGKGAVVDLAQVEILSPIDHPDPAHLLVSGTGLTHLGSAEQRDRMHRELSGTAQLTDSMKMFRMGLEGGKPPAGQRGVQPEWFFKGDGSCLVAPGAPLSAPDFALDGGEEPEIAGVYLIKADGNPIRIGFALGNEFSDHVTERHNYLWLAHSKLRPAALGPELLVGELPRQVRGTSRILRGEQVIWEKPFVSGEDNMSHTVANLEHHHFKYASFRRPGDVHVHFFGTGTLSFGDGAGASGGRIRDCRLTVCVATAQCAGQREDSRSYGERALTHFSPTPPRQRGAPVFHAQRLIKTQALASMLECHAAREARARHRYGRCAPDRTPGADTSSKATNADREDLTHPHSVTTLSVDGAQYAHTPAPEHR